MVIASLPTNAFTFFAMPHNIIASSQDVLGGHNSGVVFGSLFFLISLESDVGEDVIYALTVECSIFVMTNTNTEHSPAVVNALTLVLVGFLPRMIMGIKDKKQYEELWI